MASTLDHAFFYNSQDNDRVYDASSFEYWLKKFFTTGVFAGECAVTADGAGMTVQMSGGYCNVDGKVRFFDAVQYFALANAHGYYDRIDTIVIERNDTDRDVTAKVVTGGYSANPVPTAPVRENGVYQLVVAQIYVAAGTVRITQANITDTRPDTSICGYVMCAVETPDFSQLYAQFLAQAAEVIDNTESDLDTWKDDFESDAEEWKDDFEDDAETWKDNFENASTQWYQIETADFAAWFESIKDQLDTDQAGHLQNEIDDITDAMEEAPWHRPIGTMTDDTGVPVIDADGDAISITTLSQAEIAAGVINIGAHY